MQTEIFSFPDTEQHKILVYHWSRPESNPPKAIVQIAHGMAEHAARYERFARVLTDAGYEVYANDHRGHGLTAGQPDRVGIIGKDGFSNMTETLSQLTDLIVGRHPEIPVFLFGHSMGSFLTQQYIFRYGSKIKGVIHSGTNGRQSKMIIVGIAIAELLALIKGDEHRSFFNHRRQYADYRTAIRRLREYRSAFFLGYGLKGKEHVQRMLERDVRFESHLPLTEAMRSVRAVVGWLKSRGCVLLKPQTGSQGRGVLLVQRSASGSGADTAAAAPEPERTVNAPPAFTVRGRDARNRRIAHGFADAPALLRWLRRFTAQRSYLLQQYLLLQSRSGDAYDVRSLVQKDGTGRWQVTGMAVRRGQNGSLTSNLHGGGTVEAADAFLTGQFDDAMAKAILNRLRELSEQIPEVLEHYHGRLAELGIDFGVDTDGHIWILEVNSKPGRSIFTYLKDGSARFSSLMNPILYTKYLLRNSVSRNSAVTVLNRRSHFAHATLIPAYEKKICSSSVQTTLTESAFLTKSF